MHDLKAVICSVVCHALTVPHADLPSEMPAEVT